MKVVYFQRRPAAGNYSVEGHFQVIRAAMPSEVECVLAQSRFESRGIFKRLYNVIEAAFRQGDINHITGDVHFLSYMLRKDKTLLTVLDCVFNQNTAGLKRYLLRLLWYVIPVNRAAIISVISEATKKELLKNVRCDPSRIRVVPVCISPSYVFIKKEFNAIKPTILQIGTAPNKNLMRLFEALQGIPCRLEIVGRLSAEHRQSLARFGIDYADSSNLTEADLVQKYQRCDLVTFVSTYEGFGMPILEANAVGRPVITGNILSMPEVAGNAACLVNPFDVQEIRSGIARVINNSDYREQLVRNGFDNIKRYDAKTIAAQYLELYSLILNG